MRFLLMMSLVLTFMFLSSRVDVAKNASRYVSAFKYMNQIYGTGFHIKYKGRIYLITNKHMCRAANEFSGYNMTADVDDKKGLKILKIWEKHDLCAIESWKVSGLSLASSGLEPLDKLILIGHPRGLPLVIREGRFAGIFHLNMGGGLQAGIITATAYPGNSGSPVLNEFGSVTGVLFAGNPYYPTEPFIVPYEFLKEFLEYLAVNFPAKKLNKQKTIVVDKKL